MILGIIFLALAVLAWSIIVLWQCWQACRRDP